MFALILYRSPPPNAILRTHDISPRTSSSRNNPTFSGHNTTFNTTWESDEAHTFDRPVHREHVVDNVEVPRINTGKRILSMSRKAENVSKITNSMKYIIIMYYAT